MWAGPLRQEQSRPPTFQKLEWTRALRGANRPPNLKQTAKAGVTPFVECQCLDPFGPVSMSLARNVLACRLSSPTKIPFVWAFQSRCQRL
jgi:hypothetical protein